MKTWFTDIVRTANERMFDDDELNRFAVYYASMPARLKLAEELEKLEAMLSKTLHKELTKQYPERSLYTKRAVQDLVEGLRHVYTSVFADDVGPMRRRWIDHLLQAAQALQLDLVHIHDAYLMLRDLLKKHLSRSTWDVLAPTYEELLDDLTATAGLLEDVA
jgi:hypothetical protein